nr:hypothetical protein [Rhodococcus wratislaviensis]GLK33763.1 hypothetical protein GCM10017611_06060 [Rhodococcus wratislaviensis]
MTAQTHHEQVRSDRRIGYHALYGPTDNDDGGEQLPGQLGIDDITDGFHRSQRPAG